ncbi:hypothetical protein F1F90_22160, partial [Salmonella enterica subsp. enterica]|nr:hypothetical protein [Salmonella enterica subsp. enterica serovar Kentucky]
LPALRVVRVLDRVAANRGKSQQIVANRSKPQQIAAIRSCYAWIMVRNLSHLHWLNGQSNMQ